MKRFEGKRKSCRSLFISILPIRWAGERGKNLGGNLQEGDKKIEVGVLGEEGLTLQLLTKKGGGGNPIEGNPRRGKKQDTYWDGLPLYQSPEKNDGGGKIVKQRLSFIA